MPDELLPLLLLLLSLRLQGPSAITAVPAAKRELLVAPAGAA
jgi:hypothetical protein